MSHPADGGSFDQHALAVPVQVVLQVLLFLGLNAELQVNVVGKLCEVAEAFFSTAHAVAQETWSLSIGNVCLQPETTTVIIPGVHKCVVNIY